MDHLCLEFLEFPTVISITLLVADLKQSSGDPRGKLGTRAGDSWVLECQLFIQGHRSVPVFPHGCTCVYWPNVSLAHIAFGSLPFSTRLNAHEGQEFCQLYFPPNEPSTVHIWSDSSTLCTWHQLLLILSQFDLKVQQSKWDKVPVFLL